MCISAVVASVQLNRGWFSAFQKLRLGAPSGPGSIRFAHRAAVEIPRDGTGVSAIRSRSLAHPIWYPPGAVVPARPDGRRYARAPAAALLTGLWAGESAGGFCPCGAHLLFWRYFANTRIQPFSPFSPLSSNVCNRTTPTGTTVAAYCNLTSSSRPTM